MTTSAGVPASGWAVPVPIRPRVADRAHAHEDVWPYTTRLLPWCVAGFLAVVWLLPFSNIEPPLGLPVAATADWPILGGVFALWLGAVAAASGLRRPGMRLTRVHAGVTIFFVLAVASVALNTDVLVNLGELSIATKRLLVLALYGVMFLVVGSVVRPDEVSRFVSLILGLAAVTALATVFEYRFETNLFYDWSSAILHKMVLVPDDLHVIDGTGRKTVYGPMGHPLELALSLALTLPFAMSRLLDATEMRAKLGYLALSGLILAGMFATERKTALIGAAVGLVVLVAYKPRSLRQLVPVLVGLFLVLHLLAPGAAGSLKQQLQPDRLAGVNSTKDRSEDYKAVGPDVLGHPVIGRGFGSYDSLKYRVIDNEYLSLIITVGALGTGAYLLMLLLGGLAAHRTARGRDPDQAAIARAAAAAVASFAAASFLFDVLAFPHVAYMMFVVLGLVAALTRRREPSGAS